MTIHFYGENGLKSRVLSPGHRHTEYFYNEHNLISCIRSGGREITLSCGERHNLVRATLPDGLQSQWEYDHRGRVLRSSDPADRLSRYKYDALGRRTSKTYNGCVTRWVRDGNTPLHEWTYDEKDHSRPNVRRKGTVDMRSSLGYVRKSS
jgi:YD repeat-containing protein